MGSTVDEQAWSHLDEQAGYAGKRGRHDDKHVPRGVLDKFAGMMGYSFPGEETARFQDYPSIEQSYWNQKLTTMEKLPLFDDEDNEELENDVHSFVDKSPHLTTAVLRRGVEMSML